MENWVAIFAVITAIALVVQVIVLSLLSMQLHKTMEQVNRTMSDLQSRVNPILTRVQILLEDTQPKISSMVSDAAHVVYLTRNQAQKVDRVFTEAADRLRGQLIHTDRIISAGLEAVEEAGSQFHRRVWRPMHKVTALVEGIKVGIDLLRSRKSGNAHREEPREQEEELFI
ncbi:MAG TPA: DUF948 domain-containing protein [Terriglobales bacterium]|nr:DUF948 domain-containing protein [Terriglobales bacterium]